jgi:hypothetical protein
MIGKIAPSGSGFAEALAYALNLKSEHQKLSKSELAEKFPEVAPTPDDPGWEEGVRHRIIGGTMSGETEPELRREFAAVRKLRPEVKNPLISLSVRKAPGDTISLRMWEEIGGRVVEGLGLRGCPFLVVQHRDKDDHIHLVASRIRLDGKTVSDSKSYEKVERVMRKVEIDYGLERVLNSSEVYDRAPTWWEHRLVNERGTLSPKLEMQARISVVLEDRPTATQFINRLREAHGIETIFRVGEGGAPCGVAFSYGGVAMSGGALGRGYTWKKLQERGLSYGERDVEAVKRSGEGARPRGQSVAGQERAIGRAARPVGDAGRSVVHDRTGGGAVQEAAVGRDGREDQGQQYSTRPGAPRGGRQPGPAGLPEAEATNGGGGVFSAACHESAAGGPFQDGLTMPQHDLATIDFHPDIGGYTDYEFILGLGGMEQSAAGLEGNQQLERTQWGGLGRPSRPNILSDVGAVNNPIHAAGVESMDYPSSPNPAAGTSGFRDGVREAIREVDDYMKDFWQEDAQYRAAIPTDIGEVAGSGADVEIETEAIIDIMML